MAKTKIKPVLKRKTVRTKSDNRTLPLSRLFDISISGDGASDRPGKPFSQSEWVFICVDAIVKMSRSIQLMLSTPGDDIVESGEAYDLLFNNKSLPFSRFITETVGYLSLYRECYWIFPEMDITRPTKIIVVGPKQLEPVIAGGVLVGYELRVEGRTNPIPLLIDDVWPLIDFNPDSRFHGVGPTDAGKLAISTAYQAGMLNEATLANGGRLSGVISMPAGARLDDNERRAYIAQFEARHKGARNAGKWALVTGGVTVSPLAQSMVDLQMIDLRKYDAATICALFGYPMELAGLNSEAQYAHGPAQQRFILNTISPLLSFVGENITSGILSRFKHRQVAGVSAALAKSFCGRQPKLKLYQSYRQTRIKAIQSQVNLFAWFAIEEHPVIQEMLRERTEKVIKYVDSGIPLNQIMDAYDLPFEHVSWGDDHFVSAGLIPARWIIEAGPEGLTPPSLPEGQTDEDEDKPAKEPAAEPAKSVDIALKAKDEVSKLRLWKNWTASWAGIEREYTASMRQYFLVQQRIIIDRLKKEVSGKSAVKSSPEETVARIVFDITRDKGRLRAINQVFFEKASELGIRQSVSEIAGTTGQPLKEAVDAVKRSQAIRRSLIVSNTNMTGVNHFTQKKLASSLLDGLKNEESLNDLTKRIQDQLGNNRSRALRIARTQTAGAVGSGRHAGFKHTGVELKTWVTARDGDNVRKIHQQAETNYSKGIPLDDFFWVGGEKLMHPGDPHATPANTANCRCVEVAIKAQGKSFTIDHWSNFKFYSYEDMKALA